MTPLAKKTSFPSITVASYIVTGFTNFFNIADYYICVYFVKVLISANSPLYYSSALGYVSGYYGIFYFSMILGVQQTIQTYTSQLIKTDNKNRINLLWR